MIHGMNYDPANPLIVQGDRTVLVEVDNPKYAEARDALAPFAELEKSPEHMHTYRLSDLSLWNAAAAGLSADDMIVVLQKYSKFPVPMNLLTEISERVERYGRVKLVKHDDKLKLICADKPLLEELVRQPKLRDYLGKRLDAKSFLIEPAHRGVLKQALITVGYPAEDLAGYTEGANFPIKLRAVTRAGLPFHVRDYQRDAADIFYAGGDVRGGSGVIVLPCGAGKTIVGIVAMSMMQKSTLILTTSITAVKQWIREIVDRTELEEKDVVEYSGEIKQIGPVTVATYLILTHRRTAAASPAPGSTNAKPQAAEQEFPHFKVFDERDWGLIIYDEVHLLPAPVFRVTANIQARRRLGLTATLIREDGREGDVFSLIGPKKYDVPWRELESKGWIAEANCTEVRVAMPDDMRMEYAVSEWRHKYRIASENPAKEDIVERLMRENDGKNILIIGQYLKQLRSLHKRFDIPLITGATDNMEREDLYGKFRRGAIKKLILSKVGNFAIDLPDAQVLIQVSGTFGSRQEEAQRLGRILRPKTNGETAHFYTLVTRDTRELDFAHHRQMFLTEQGYSYSILDAADLQDGRAARDEGREVEV
jgi:DNA excision repair protein ERCC-3